MHFAWLVINDLFSRFIICFTCFCSNFIFICNEWSLHFDLLSPSCGCNISSGHGLVSLVSPTTKLNVMQLLISSERSIFKWPESHQKRIGSVTYTISSRMCACGCGCWYVLWLCMRVFTYLKSFMIWMAHFALVLKYTLTFYVNLWFHNISSMPLITFRDKLEHDLLAQLTMCCQQPLTFMLVIHLWWVKENCCDCIRF